VVGEDISQPGLIDNSCRPPVVRPLFTTAKFTDGFTMNVAYASVEETVDGTYSHCGRRADYSTRIGNWRNHLPRVAGQIALHGSITEDLIEFGYEIDDSWLSILKDVNPDYKPSHWTEEARRQHRITRLWLRAWADAILIVALRLFGWRIV
jgi:hypothetical protein